MRGQEAIDRVAEETGRMAADVEVQTAVERTTLFEEAAVDVH